ncbi:MAG: DUF2220 family protein [Anaerotignum sp.]|nr:DUF2220 family protein [Anaerotignum sp.]
MINILKACRKKTIDVYELAFEYGKKPILQWSCEEINAFIEQLQGLCDENIIQIKRSAKGEANLDFIERKITIKKWNLDSQIEGVSLDLFRHDLGMDASYYLKNLEQYHRDKPYIERLKAFLSNNTGQLTLNEISYQVFKDEKALSQPEKASVNGKRILVNLGLDSNRIPYVETIAPFYYPVSSEGDTVLVVENKDTCFSLLRIFQQKDSNIKGILFGEGRAVVKIFKFLQIYGLGNRDLFLYYGDIDQEGFDIARSLIEKYSEYRIKLSKALYHSLLVYEGRPLLHKRMIDTTKASGILSDLFDEDVSAIGAILDADGCIPQEALNYEDMRVIMDELQYRLF